MRVFRLHDAETHESHEGVIFHDGVVFVHCARRGSTWIYPDISLLRADKPQAVIDFVGAFQDGK